jgi:nucleoid-associated protein YgaU
MDALAAAMAAKKAEAEALEAKKAEASAAEKQTDSTKQPQTAEQTRIASELADLHIKRRDLEERIEELKNLLLDTDAPVGYTFYSADGDRVGKVQRAGRRFDTLKASTVLPEGLLQQISSMQINTKLAKAVLPPEVYDELMTDGKVSIVLSRG